VPVSGGGALVLSVAAVACAGAAGAAAVRGDVPRRRLGRLLAGERPTRGRSRHAAGERPDDRLRMAVSGLAGLACAVLLGGATGWAAGALVAVLCARVLVRLEPRAVRQRRARIVADLPVAIDLLAACLQGGGTWHESVETVAAAIGGPLGEELARVAARIRLGVDPAEEWLGLAREPVMAPLGRAAARAAVGGVPIAATLARLARDQRRKARIAASDRARTAGVRSVAPLGLCFLPAFVLLGVVPAIAGMASNILLP
jgi:Flp pilus assembly protein TadB